MVVGAAVLVVVGSALVVVVGASAVVVGAVVVAVVVGRLPVVAVGGAVVPDVGPGSVVVGCDVPPPATCSGSAVVVDPIVLVVVSVPAVVLGALDVAGDVVVRSAAPGEVVEEGREVVGPGADGATVMALGSTPAVVAADVGFGSSTVGSGTVPVSGT